MTVFTIGQANGLDTNVRLRAALSALVTGTSTPLRTRTGMLGNGLVVTRTSGMGVAVSAGRLWVAGTVEGQYGYAVISDAVTPLTLDDGSAAARTDLICVQVRDNPFDGTGSGNVGPRITVVKGASGGGVPSTPAGYVKLAEQPVPANASAGTGGLTSDPVDRRPPRTAAAGGIVGVVDADDRNTLALHKGLTVFRYDTGVRQMNLDGTAAGWDNEWRTLTPTNVQTGNGVFVSARAYRDNQRVTLDVTVTAKKTYTTDSLGNLPDTLIGNLALPTGWGPASQINVDGYRAGVTGLSWRLDPNGDLYLAWGTATGVAIAANGDVLAVRDSYMLG